VPPHIILKVDPILLKCLKLKLDPSVTASKIDALSPSLILDLTETVDAKWTNDKIEAADAHLANDLILSEDDILVASIIDSFWQEPIEANPSTLNALPTLLMPLIEREEAKLVKSSTDNEEPHLIALLKLIALPINT
jgi:hypothetical protein